MITQAIIPLAGLGTRMLPFSKVIPKDLLPLGNVSILERILLECEDAGIKKIYLIISKKKEIIKKYFQDDLFLESKVKNQKSLIKKLNLLKKFKKKKKFIYQDTPKGLGDAVYKCSKVINSQHSLKTCGCRDFRGIILDKPRRCEMPT